MKFDLSNNNKRYHTLDYYYKNKFNCKVFKISLNMGLSCPHLNKGGCIYCSNKGSGEYAGDIKDDIITQFNKGVNMMNKKWKGKYIGYFQARTNTLAPVDFLKEKYETILKQENVIGLSIATRPDCISDECLEYLKDLNKKTFLTIELGLQTIHNKTSILINRCHDLNCFKECVLKLRKNNINVVVHIINGLPYETKEMMIDTVKYLNKLDIQGIKIHMLCILKNTKLARIYEKEKFHVLTKEEYIEITCEQLKYLRKEIVIHRLCADPKIDDLIEPKWVVKKIDVLNSIDKYMAKNDIIQGMNVNIQDSKN